MLYFTYNYKGEARKGSAEILINDGTLLYKIKMTSDTEFTIAPMGITSPGHKIIWVQSHKPHEFVLAHDLVQALGEGIETVLV